MGPKLLHFIKYNNAVSIAAGLLFLSFSGALAASPEVRNDVASAVLSQQLTVKSVDNSYIVNKDLSTYTPAIQITGVTEDADNYYVAYTISTIDVVNYVWQDAVEPKTMQVSKVLLNGEDLGLYVTSKLADIEAWQVAYLKRVQDIEKAKGVQQAVVATAYSGLVGRFLDPKEEVLPGYTPVIPPPEPVTSGDGSSSGTDTSGSASASTAGGPVFQILGNNPAQIPVGAGYIDLGAVVTDPVQQNIGYQSSGAELINTTQPATFTVTYTATDQAGNTSTATRTVIVYDPAKGPPVSVPAPAVVPPPVITPPPPAPTTASSDTAGSSSDTVSSTASSTPDNAGASTSTPADDASAATTTSASATTSTDDTTSGDPSSSATSTTP